MPLPQDFIDARTPMGATLVPGRGATFRVWAPHALEVHVLGTFNGWARDDASLLVSRDGGDWTGFVPAAREGDRYLLHVTGTGSAGRKRDPYARELTVRPAWPACECVLVDERSYPWHDAGYRPPPFHELVVYQLHVGTFSGPDRAVRTARFLDLIDRLDHLHALGVNAVQLLPVVEFQTAFSMGYNGTDYFSPEMDYEVEDPAEIERYRPRLNARLASEGMAPLEAAQLRGGTNQLKALVDLCHLRGIAVLLDVVYNHAGGDFGDESLYFLDRQPPEAGNRNSLYFSERGWAGGLVFDFEKERVRQFLIDNALYWLTEMHVDGLRFDEVSVIDRESAGGSGWLLCQHLTGTARYVKPAAVQNAEYWPVNAAVVRPPEEGGAGFDVTQHDGLREALRAALAQASWGMSAPVDMARIGAALERSGLPHPWQAVHCVENHDRVYRDREQRLPALADPSDHRSWFARSRSRVASAVLLTAPGIPMLFMGQEMLEDKQWHDSRDPAHLVWWGGIEGEDRHAGDHLRFMQDLVWLRRRSPALAGGAVRVLHADGRDRVLAHHRWIEGEGQDVVVVASLNDSTLEGFRLGFPGPGPWREVFNSDVYDHFVNPRVAGNGGRVLANEGPMHGMPASAALTVPANAVLVFTR